MLFILTCADMASVGPGVLNDWKVGVLADLYTRTLDHLDAAPRRVADRRASMRMAVWQLLSEDERDSSWFKRQFAALPEPFVVARSPAAVAGTLRRMKRLGENDESNGNAADAWGGYHEDGASLEMVAAVVKGAGRGVFSSMAGALSSKGLRILTAETSVLEDEVLLLRFMAEDPQATEAMNAAEANARVKSISAAMLASIDSDTPPRFPRVWGADRQTAAAALAGQPNEVRIDTEISDQCAIVEVFTIDRTGLLYELARALHELNLVIYFARISTSLDQAVDVYYVTERDGQKPTDAERLAEINLRLMDVIEK